jgi:hypothetical protein
MEWPLIGHRNPKGHNEDVLFSIDIAKTFLLHDIISSSSPEFLVSTNSISTKKKRSQIMCKKKKKTRSQRMQSKGDLKMVDWCDGRKDTRLDAVSPSPNQEYYSLASGARAPTPIDCNLIINRIINVPIPFRSVLCRHSCQANSTKMLLEALCLDYNYFGVRLKGLFSSEFFYLTTILFLFYLIISVYYELTRFTRFILRFINKL